MPRFLLLALNAVAVGFLIYQLLRVYQTPDSGTKKRITLIAGVVLLLLPVTMIFGFLRPTPAYLLVYPIGIFLFLYLFRLT